MTIQALFFDAGNTLVFADRPLTLAPLISRGLTVGEDQIHAAERAARHFRDANASPALARNTDQQYWDIYYRELLGPRASDQALLAELVAAARNSSNWCHVPPGTREALIDLKRNYRLGIISNSDGHIADLFHRAGLADLFESITDSGRVGHQKPDPEIFRVALDTMKVPANESAYIGDVYSIDFVGARNAGMKAILMDPYGTYSENGLPRITRLTDLEPLLSTM